MLHNQPSSFTGFLKAFVVIGVSPAGVLDIMDEVIVMDHLMAERSADTLNGPSQRPGRDVNLMAAARHRKPGVRSEGKMPIGFRAALDGDGGS